MTRRRVSAFTLIEMVVLLFLAGVILFAVSQLTRETYKTLVFLREKAQTQESAVLGVERLTSDLREAVTPPVSSGNTVSFSKVKPGEPKAKNAPPHPNPNDIAYASYVPPVGPYTGSQLTQVTYQLTDGNLQRTIGTFTSMLAENVNDFSVTPRGNGSYEVLLTIQENRRVQTFESFVTCPGITP
jgi:Tfp pilus assembly protein PilW